MQAEGENTTLSAIAENTDTAENTSSSCHHDVMPSWLACIKLAKTCCSGGSESSAAASLLLFLPAKPVLSIHAAEMAEEKLSMPIHLI